MKFPNTYNKKYKYALKINRPCVAWAVLKTPLLLITCVIHYLWKYLQNTVSLKPLELGTREVEAASQAFKLSISDFIKLLFKETGTKNPAYGTHQIYWPMRIVAPMLYFPLLSKMGVIGFFLQKKLNHPPPPLPAISDGVPPSKGLLRRRKKEEKKSPPPSQYSLVVSISVRL